MASSSSSPRRAWKYDVFPSFSGEDVRKSFLSHLLEKLQRKLIITFIDNGIERSRLIAPELLSAIRESRISIVVFSKKYASSTWCLNELAEIYKCFKEMNQMVIPVFYELDPSDVRKQTGEFGKSFEETCKGKTEDVKQRWIRALAEVASIAGYDSRNWSDEPMMIEEISSDVSKKLFTPSDDFRDFVGIEAHVEAIMDSKLCLQSEDVRIVGILGPSGIGKTIIARALFSRLSSHFQHRAFVTPKRAAMQDRKDEVRMKLGWAKQLLSELLGQKDIVIESLGMVEQRLKEWKVLIVLDDVDDLKLLKTLVGCTGWFGFGSRIIVVTQDKALLEKHKIKLIYEVEFPSEDLALQMFCQSAFGETSPPDGFMELAAEVAKLSGNLPLGLNVLGLSLRERNRKYWEEMMPRLRKGLNGEIEKTLRICYDGLIEKDDQDMFLYIACLFNGETVNSIKDLLPVSVYPSASISLTTLAEKSLVRIIGSPRTVQMHILLQKLGREIVREESILNPGERRFLVDAKDIYDVFEDDTGTNKVLGIYCNTSEIDKPLSMDENCFKRMHNLQFLKFYKDQGAQKTGEFRLNLSQGGLVFLPRKLRLLHWDECPLKCMPSNFKAEYLVKLSMKNSKLDKLWEGTQQLRSLKKLDIAGSANLKEIPDLSYAINLEKMNLLKCTSLVTLPSSVRNLKKLITLRMGGCSKLEILPTDVNLKSLINLDLTECSRLRSFPKISKNISKLFLDGLAIEEEEESSWIEYMSRFTVLFWNFYPLSCLPSNFRPGSLRFLVMRNSKLEKLWEGVQSLGNLLELDLAGSENLKEIPNLSKATGLKELYLNGCKSLVTVPCSIRSLNKLQILIMTECTRLESLPTNLNLKSLSILNLSGCSQLKSFPQISRNIDTLVLNDTAIEEVPSWINYFSKLRKLEMRGCKRLKNISANIFELQWLAWVDFFDCEGVTELGDAESLKDISHSFYHRRLNFYNCLSLDQNAQKLIIQSGFNYAVLPGGQVPQYFTHRASGSSLTIPLPEGSLLEEVLRFKVCIVLEPLTVTEFHLPCVEICWYFGGKTGVCHLHFEHVSIKMDHLLVFHVGFPTEEITEFPLELKFEFNYRIYCCSHKLHDGTCDTEACPYSVQRIKGCGMWRHVTVFEDDSEDDSVEAYIDSSSSLENETQIIYDSTTLGLRSIYDSLNGMRSIYDSFMDSYDDNRSLGSLDEEEEEEYWKRHQFLTDDEELNISSFFDEEEEDAENHEVEDTENHEEEALDNLPVHSTITPDYITQWIYDSTYYC